MWSAQRDHLGGGPEPSTGQRLLEAPIIVRFEVLRETEVGQLHVWPSPGVHDQNVVQFEVPPNDALCVVEEIQCQENLSQKAPHHYEPVEAGTPTMPEVSLQRTT